ncbi:MAG: hypothetical protein NZ899_01580 [Thermoguttaceae bacterium]|nr:hypothetical protein [Thermoguttaceae bacterium]
MRTPSATEQQSIIQAATWEQSVSWRSALGPRWGLVSDTVYKALTLETGSGKRVTARLGGGGFGFDQPIGMSLTPSEIILYTPDGTVRYARGDELGPPAEIIGAEAVPAEARAADAGTLAGSTVGSAALISRDGKQVWALQSGQWSSPPASAVRRAGTPL